MRGRKPSGPAAVEQLAGSPQAKQRLRVVLETLTGECRVGEACARLEISEPRFDQLRTQVLQAGLDRLEPRPVGRRPRPAGDAHVGALEARVAELEIELRAAQVREEIALALPQVQVAPAAPEKKAPRRRSPAWPRRRTKAAGPRPRPRR
jgi:hypothetical protein